MVDLSLFYIISILVTNEFKLHNITDDIKILGL